MKKLFSLYDCKAHLYSTPVESVNMATAKRMFKVGVENAGFPITDYQVVCLGEFDETNGVITAIDKEIDELGGANL